MILIWRFEAQNFVHCIQCFRMDAIYDPGWLLIIALIQLFIVRQMSSTSSHSQFEYVYTKTPKWLGAIRTNKNSLKI